MPWRTNQFFIIWSQAACHPCLTYFVVFRSGVITMQFCLGDGRLPACWWERECHPMGSAKIERRQLRDKCFSHRFNVKSTPCFTSSNHNSVKQYGICVGRMR